MRTFVKIWGYISQICAIAGCFFLFSGDERIGYLLAAAVVLNSILQVFIGNRKNLIPEVIQVVVAIGLPIFFDFSIIKSLALTFTAGEVIILCVWLLFFSPFMFNVKKIKEIENYKYEVLGKEVFYCSMSIVVFWLLVAIGPAVVMLFNKIGYVFSGAGYGEGSLMYKVLLFLSQPIACCIAAAAADFVGQYRHRNYITVNCALSICLFSVLAFSEFLNSDYLHMASMAVSAISTICLCIGYAKESHKQA